MKASRAIPRDAMALGHLVTPIMLAITIVGIPFACAHFETHRARALPIDKTILPA
jgi:uncharacterized membrane protein YccF (DUF307 family)